ncbi:MAG TPA: hypothetical protein VJ997_02060 [Longimicrobiales bacterium]|nr:hypothetical protein [Longimicrobiales bacterium]
MVSDDSAASRPARTPVPARAGAAPPPTPVRTSLGDERGEAAHEEAPRATVQVHVDGTSWTARVGGVTRSGAGGASAPILLLRFEAEGGGEETAREAWVVGRSLAGLSELQLEAACRRSEPAPANWVRKPLFPEAGSRSGKDG